MAGYQKLSVLLVEELDQLREEGFDFVREDFEKRINEANDNKEILMKIYEEFKTLPLRSDFTYNEPSEYEEILALSNPNPKRLLLDDKEMYDKVYGAWYGRCIGCALGQPVELWSAETIKTWCEKADAYPIDFYIPTHSRAETEDGLKLVNPTCSTENIKFMSTDDDIRYTICGFILTQDKGFDWDSWDVGTLWLIYLAYHQLCTAEKQAYLNFTNIDENTPWGRPENAMKFLKENNISTYINPYREWIGAQIRIDAYGYVAAGDPHKAAELAFNDAYFSHTKNGIYGAMFFAALIAAAATSETLEEAIALSLNEIPSTSRFYEMALKSIEIAKNATSDDELIKNILEEYQEYNVVHTINNAALCIASIYYSKGDFNKALTLSVMGGMDTDCNGATVGSVMGAFVGIDGISDKWKDPINDLLYSAIPDYHPIKISELAKRTLDIQKKCYSENK